MAWYKWFKPPLWMPCHSLKSICSEGRDEKWCWPSLFSRKGVHGFFRSLPSPCLCQHGVPIQWRCSVPVFYFIWVAGFQISKIWGAGTVWTLTDWGGSCWAVTETSLSQKSSHTMTQQFGFYGTVLQKALAAFKITYFGLLCQLLHPCFFCLSFSAFSFGSIGLEITLS